MTKSIKKVVGRGAAYIYIETIGSMISGYIFWIIMSRITTTETIGISSAVVSFASIVAVIASIGIPTGVQRFIGKSFSEKKLDDVKAFVITSLLLICIGIVACSTLILIAQNWIYGVFRFDFSLMIIALFLIGSSTIAMLLRSVVIASLKTKSLPFIIISSSIVKLILAIILVLMGTGALGLTIGLTFNHVLSSILLGIVVMTTIFKSSRNNNLLTSFVHYSKNILHASVVYWIPLLITAVGYQMGTIVVFGSQGPNQAGVYFLALTIVTGITSVMNSLFTIALPALSSLQDYRKRFAWQTIRLSAIIILPFSCSLIFYSKEIMQILGRDYVKGSSSLEVLLLSLLPMAVISGVNALVYSYGNYRQVLIIGLAMNIPRTVLYFLLVPIYGGIGAALGYTIGSIIGCIVSIVIAKKIGMLIFWKDLAVIFIIPTTIAFALSYLQINYIIGILATIVISYVLLLKIHIVTSTDVKDTLDVLPESVSIQVIKLKNKFRKLVHDY
jgi:O-antigen/teichoic acid export membrane protein